MKGELGFRATASHPFPHALCPARALLATASPSAWAGDPAPTPTTRLAHHLPPARRASDQEGRSALSSPSCPRPLGSPPRLWASPLRRDAGHQAVGDRSVATRGPPSSLKLPLPACGAGCPPLLCHCWEDSLYTPPHAPRVSLTLARAPPTPPPAPVAAWPSLSTTLGNAPLPRGSHTLGSVSSTRWAPRPPRRAMPAAPPVSPVQQRHLHVSPGAPECPEELPERKPAEATSSG